MKIQSQQIIPYTKEIQDATIATMESLVSQLDVLEKRLEALENTKDE